jgi:hypothetical protein
MMQRPRKESRQSPRRKVAATGPIASNIYSW